MHSKSFPAMPVQVQMLRNTSNGQLNHCLVSFWMANIVIRCYKYKAKKRLMLIAYRLMGAMLLFEHNLCL